MTRHLVSLALVLGSLSMGLFAQDSRRARPRRAAPVVSPEILDSGRVTFRIAAPNAKEVRVNGQWPDGRSEMARNEVGVWQVTLGPMPAGVWEYGFQVDGVSMIDPGNGSIKPMHRPRTSILHIVGKPELIHDFRPVPHGSVHQHSYASDSLGRLRQLVVYTPPGYEKSRRKRYPSLYLQHGSGDNQDTWTVHGKAHWIIDNLIAEERAQKMIIVMMDGHASADRQHNTSAFENDLLEEVMPFVSENYRIKKGAKNRGIVGLSMGGGQSLTIGLKHTDLFAWVGGFSSSVPRAESVAVALDDPKRTNRQLQLLWIACGKDDFLLERNKNFVAKLSEIGVEHVWRLTEGNHSWPVWREYLADFVPKLFQ